MGSLLSNYLVCVDHRELLFALIDDFKFGFFHYLLIIENIREL